MSGKLIANVMSLGIAATASMSSAAVVDNFNSYPSGSNLNANGWSGAASSIVYPDAGSGLVPPAYPPIEGAQSVYVGGGTHGRGWGAASSAIADGSILSYYIKMEVNATAGQQWFFLSHNVGVGGGGTPAGIIIDHASDLVRLSGSAESATSFATAHNTVYKFEMELDFTNDEFDAYVTDITNGGARTFLGTRSTPDLDAGDVAANGGVFIGNFGGGSYAFWDDIQVNPIPEPASLGLIGLAGAALLRRRK